MQTVLSQVWKWLRFMNKPLFRLRMRLICSSRLKKRWVTQTAFYCSPLLLLSICLCKCRKTFGSSCSPCSCTILHLHGVFPKTPHWDLDSQTFDSRGNGQCCRVHEQPKLQQKCYDFHSKTALCKLWHSKH